MKLQLPSVTTKAKKRLGRGIGSGVGGHTIGRGIKGQRSRVGRGIPLWFEGGELPLIKRLPFLRGKLRFSSLNVRPQLVSLQSIAKLSEKEITPEVLKAHRLIKDLTRQAKVVGKAELTKAISLVNMKTSHSAKERIVQAGGKVD